MDCHHLNPRHSFGARGVISSEENPNSLPEFMDFILLGSDRSCSTQTVPGHFFGPIHSVGSASWKPSSLFFDVRQDVFGFCNHKFSLKTVLMLGDQMRFRQRKVRDQSTHFYCRLCLCVFVRCRLWAAMVVSVISAQVSVIDLPVGHS